jgi:hypothetical protein
MHVFFLWMLVSSGLGFVKVLTLARVLPPADFGHYVTLFGAATLSGTLLSFGLVEATIKLYPRVWVAGGRQLILNDARRVALRVVQRFAAATVVFASLAAVLDLGYPPLIYLLAGITGLGVAMLGLTASMLRASDSPDGLRKFNFARSAIAFAVVVPGAYMFHWKGAVAGEALAGMLSLFHCRLLIRAAYPTAVSQPGSTEPEPPVTAVQGSGGTKLYLANMFSSSTSMLDRSFINVVLGPAFAGSYGVLVIVFQIGQLLVNILAQRVGPLVIKARATGDRSHGTFGRLRNYGLLLAGAMFGLVAMLLIARMYDLPSGFFGKYEISATSLVLAGVVGLLQIYALLEFYLLAQDRENEVLLASVIGSVSFFGLFTLAAVLHLKLEWFLACACLAKLVHVGMLSVIVKTPPRQGSA